MTLLNTNMVNGELKSVFYSAPVSVAYATSVTPDLTIGNVFTTTMTGNLTLDNLTFSDYGFYYYYITVDGVGGHTFSLGANWNLISGSFDNTANAVNILSFMVFPGVAKAQLFINQRP